MNVLAILSAVLQLVGVTVALVGVGETLRRYGVPDARPAVRAFGRDLGEVGRSLWGPVRSWLGLRRNARVHGLAGVITVTVEASGTVVKGGRGFQPYDDSSSAAELASLKRRTEDLMARIEEIRLGNARTDSKVERHEEQIEEVWIVAEGYTQAQLHRYASEGLLITIVGVGLTFLGLVLGVFAVLPLGGEYPSPSNG